MSYEKKILSGHPNGCPDIIVRTLPACFVFLVFFVTALIPLDTLHLRDVKNSRSILCRPIAAGERFSLSYIHSSELSTVTDYFQVAGDNEIVLYESRFCSLNTGLPSVTEKDEKLRREGDCFRLDNRNIKMHSFDFWAERKYSNKLYLADAVYNIPALLGGSSEKSVVRLRIAKISLGRILWCNLP